jgi:hypothetical protein
MWHFRICNLWSTVANVICNPFIPCVDFRRSVLHNLPYLNRKLTQLEAEVKKLQGNQFLSPDEKRAIVRGKFDVLVKPVLFVLEQLHEITSGESETKHETWFQERFGESARN